MTSSLVARQEVIHFYAPDKKTHYFFEEEEEEIIKICSNNFTTWIVRTYLQVKKSGIPCKIVDTIPEEGIVIADRDTLSNAYPYLGKVMLICAKGDREFHPSAHFHVVQNPVDIQNTKNSLWNPYYIPIWAQPGLVPRAIIRGSLVENVAFVGARDNLAKDFYSEKWNHALSSLGCNWAAIFDRKKWCDYSNIDIVVAVRSFDKNSHTHKPASKLVNCWRASVPAVLAPESAFLSVRESELDFLIVNSIEEAIDAVRSLKENPELYMSMIENGLKRAQEFDDEKIAEYWINFFQIRVFPEYTKWSKRSEASRISLFAKRYLRLKKDRMKSRLFSKLSRLRR